MLVLRSVTSFISYLQSALSATSQEQSKQSQRGWAQVKSNSTSADLNIFGNWCDPNRSQVSWFSPDIFSRSEPCGSFGLLVLEISDSEGQPASEHLAASCSCSPLRQVYPWIPAPSLEQSWKGLWPEGRKEGASHCLLWSHHFCLQGKSSLRAAGQVDRFPRLSHISNFA